MNYLFTNQTFFSILSNRHSKKKGDLMENNPIVSKDNNTESDTQKHFITLHLSHKGKTKTVGLKKTHAIAAGVAAILILGGGTYAGVSYYHTQHLLHLSEQQRQEMENENRKLLQKTEVLENENAQYNQDIEVIQQKAEQLENRMTELENTKQGLADELNQMNQNDTASAETTSANACLSILENHSVTEKNFTTIVTTAYHKSAALSAQLDKMNVMLDATGASFVDVATNVTQTLAQKNNVPSGFPVEDGIVTTEFNPDGNTLVSDGRVHKGIDLSTKGQSAPIMATAGGTVMEADYHSDFGFYVKVDHGNGFITLYAHNAANLVQVGDNVKKGDIIAMTGSTGMSTGIHCHYEIQLNGIYQDPRDYE